MRDDRNAEKSGPRSRVIGAVYLAYFLTTVPGVLLLGTKFAQFGSVLVLVSTVLYAVVVALFYALFAPVQRGVSLVAMLIGLAGCVANGLGEFHIAGAVNPIVFFGPYCVVIGGLIVASHFVPRIFGVLMIVAGAAWLAYLVPEIQRIAGTEIDILGFVAEFAFMLWLLIAGVRSPSPT
jgi:hypothetical protein